ncbi:hypothetical protein DXT99_04145 [Pontibacter diazotrophicus]|uniref:Lipoprotein n=1 Tax=Pontibacter diazotrophicus TaxID=1400979 RepID=A0A3D8LG34_9BACT|nr:hypothetical protein [Pontibacter diazotrophicus]RDV16401.1 hypothetical protein DXT99_04145 [Pontibacter diazotrophicus]
MNKSLQNLACPALLLFTLTVFSCQSGTEEGTIASTHPELADQLAKDSVSMPITDNQNPDLYQRYQITMEEYARSGEFDVGDMYRGRLAPLDESSHADTRTYRTALREGLEEGVNFAGRYTVVTVGCGTNCQQHYVVDRETGKVLDKLQSSIGAKFTPNSRLFIVNPPDSTVRYGECRDCTPEAYVFENKQFRKLPAAK